MLAAFSKATMGSPRSVTASCGIESVQKRFASKAAAGKTKNGRDSQPKYLGLKKGNGQFVKTGHILMRQRGTRFHAGQNVGIGKDHTLYATQPGYMLFSNKEHMEQTDSAATARKYARKFIHVVQDNPNPHVKQDIR